MIVHDEVGRGNFLAIYVGAGVFGAFASFTRLVLIKAHHAATLGASGAIAGLVAAWLWLEPESKYLALDSVLGEMLIVQKRRELLGMAPNRPSKLLFVTSITDNTCTF